MAEGEDKPDFHSIEEFATALGMSDAGWARLRQLARNRCCLRLPGEEEDVLQEAITRVLAGRRRWRKGVDLHAFLSGVMKSIVSERRGIGFRRNVDADLGPALHVASPDADAGDIAFEKEVEMLVMALFREDDEAQLIVEGRLDGMDKAELMDLFAGDETRYDTACRRIRRKLNRHPEVRERIHGE